MQLLELANTLPNGLHDSEVSEFVISYADRTIRLTLNVWVGNVECMAALESYRQAVIIIRDFVYCVFDRPDDRYPYGTTRRLTIDAVGPDTSQVLDGDGEALRLWVAEWNGFIHIRAGEATLNWMGPETVRS